MIVQACLNGARPAGYHPALPLTPEAIARDADRTLACISAWRTVWRFVELCSKERLSTRVGLEDGCLLPDGTMAPDSEALIAAAHRQFCSTMTETRIQYFSAG